jgi:hypothetical protein
VITVRPKTIKWQAMQFRADNASEFLNWADKTFGISSSPMYAWDDDNNIVDGHVWLGRRGDDRDTRVMLNEWVVQGALGPLTYSAERFEEHYEEVPG